MKLLHTSDVHLTGGDDEASSERLLAFEWLLQEATKQACDAVLITGDLFDSPKAADACRAQVRAMADVCPVPIVIVPGNHDEAAYPAGAPLGVRATVLSGAPLVVHDLAGGGRLVAAPWREDASLADSLLSDRTRAFSTDQPVVLATHGTFLHEGNGALWRWLDDSGEGRSFPILDRDLEGRRLSYVALGHFHTARVWNVAGIPVAYAGTPSPVHRTEEGRRQAWIVEIVGGAAAQLTALPVAPSSWWAVREVFATPHREEKAIDEVRAVVAETAGANCRLSLTLAGFVAADRPAWEAKVHEVLREHKKRLRELHVSFDWEAAEEAAPLHVVREFLAGLDEIQARGAAPTAALAAFLSAERLDVRSLRGDAIRYGLQAFQQALRKGRG